MTERAHGTPNRLAQETSPYLLQHAQNPVDWYPWGPEALERARREQRPIFLSIGYSACHWCHVMERECFEDAAIAAQMNADFVNIKVDREERPDLDEIYMKAVTALSGGGGWPMSVFLTPELEPFFGGTYFPPVRRYGRPSFPDVLRALSDAWRQQREQVISQAAELTAIIVAESSTDVRGVLEPGILGSARDALLGAFDREWGGFGAAPKFPHSGDIRLLLRAAQRKSDAAALHAATFTLDHMAQGGIHDQLGGGFHRYSTDAKWCIPHFEKMLYDNALLVPAYLDAHLLTGNAEYAEVARAACDWVLREMITAEGGFASAQDADSEGEEGRFFVWTPEQLDDVLGEELGAIAAAYFDVTEQGNFEDSGRSALWRPHTAREVAARLRIDEAALAAAIAKAKPKLLAARAARPRPLTDDKVLAAWNGLMIGALAYAHQTLDDARYLAAAQRAARYLLSGMRQPDGRLFATARHGRAHLNACLDDYVFVIAGLLDLHESDFDPRWLREALALTDVVEARFADPANGGYCTTGEGHEVLIARTKTLHDGALPSGTGMQALNLLRLSELCGRADLAGKARDAIASQAALVNRHPRLFSQLLLAVDFLDHGPREVVISGEPGDAAAEALLRAVRSVFSPQRVVARAVSGADVTLQPLLSGRTSGAGGAMAYVCRDFTCEAPIADAAELTRALQDKR
jgi:uncharacterized protein YyaL (SSP411 family)